MILENAKKKFNIKIVLICLLCLVLLFIGIKAVFSRNKNVDDPADAKQAIEKQDFVNIPQDGDPSEHTPKENINICMSVINNMISFKSETTGKVSAKVGFIDYAQDVHNQRVVGKDKTFVEAISTSSLKKVGEQKYITDNAIVLRQASGWNGNTPTWSDNMIPITKQAYEENYGQSPKLLTNYVINDSTIVSIDEVSKANGQYTYKLSLKPKESTVYYKRQVKTMGGASQFPVFHSVNLTITIDNKWQPLKIVTSENYDISIPVIGSANCDANLTEVFSDFSAKSSVNLGDFENYMENEFDPNKVGGLPTTSDDTLKMIQDIFAKQPSYKLNLNINGKKCDFNVNVDIKNNIFKIQGKLPTGENVFAAYANDNLYLHLGTQKVKFAVSNLLDAGKIALNSFGVELNIPTMNSDTLSSLMKYVTISNSENKMVVTINHPNVNGKVILATGDGIAIKNISASLKYNNISASVGIIPISGVSFENLEGYTDLTPALSLTKPLVDTINAKGYDTSITLNYGEQKINGNLLISRVNNSVNLSLTTKVLDRDLTVKLINKTAYIDFGNMKVSCNIDEIQNTLKEVLSVIPSENLPNISIPKAYEDFFKNISADSVINAIQKVSYNNGALNITAKIGTDNLVIGLTKNSASISGIKIDNKVISAKIILNKTYSISPTISASGEYVNAKDLANFIPTIKDLINAKGYDTSIMLNYGEEKVNANLLISRVNNSVNLSLTTKVLDRDLTVKLINKTAYIDFGNIKVSCNIDEIQNTLKEVLSVIPSENLPNISIPKAYEDFFKNISADSVINAIQKVSYNNGALNITAKIGTDNLVIGLTKNSASISGIKIDNKVISAKIILNKTYPTSPTISASGEYVNAKDLANFIPTIKELINAKGYDTSITLNYGEQKINGNLLISRVNNSVNLSLTTKVLDRDLTVKLINKTAYIDFGNIKVSCNIDEIQNTLKEVLSVIPSENLPNISIPKAYEDFFKNISADSVINAIQKVSYNNGALNITAKIGTDNLVIGLTKNSASISGIKIDNKVISAKIILNKTYPTSPTISASGEYVNAKDLANLIVAIKNTITQKQFAISFNSTIYKGTTKINDMNATVYFELTSEKTFNTHVVIDVTGDSNHKLDFVYKDKNFYCDYNGLKLKMSSNDLIPILASVKDITGFDIPLLDELLECDENQKIDLSMFKKYIPDFNFNTKIGVNDLIDAINSIQSKDGYLVANINTGFITGNDNAQNISISFKTTNTVLDEIKVDRITASTGKSFDMNFKFLSTDNFNISIPTDTNKYMNLNSVNGLLRDFSNTAMLNQYHVTGNFNASVIGIGANIPFDLRITLDKNYNPTGYIKFNVPYVPFVTNNETTSEVYLVDNMIYIKRTIKKIKWFRPVYETDYMKVSMADFTDNYMKYIYHTFNLTGTIQNTINNSLKNSSSNIPLTVENVWNNYSFENNNTYKLTLNGNVLLQDDNFSSIVMGIKTNGKHLTHLDIDTGVSIIDLSISADLVDIGKNVDMSPIPSNIKTDKKYVLK